MLVVVWLGAAMWVAEVLDALLGGSLDRFGIIPRTVEGLVGVVVSPLLHGGFGHLMANTVPFLLLGGLVAWRSGPRFVEVLATIWLISGAVVWLLAPAGTVTVGASGLIFGFLTFLVVNGVVTRHWTDILVGVGVFLIYGPLLWGAVPLLVPAGVSWLAHLGGAGAGVLAALGSTRAGQSR